ncbi:MAG: 2'-5' RNA ligase family protein [Candidatus Beckwithbacteria bacterium]|nr:2'-5' RNA ligase family protein [Candidatus Beckwithbacteria bacterium]
MKRFSFWLLPDKEIQAVYQPIIDLWSRKLKTPNFEPHITITTNAMLKGEEKSVMQVVGSVIKNLQPIPIEFSEVSVSTTWAQCVFARVKPNYELLLANQYIKSAAGHPDPSMYTPHMSLVYGNLDLKQRLEIAENITLPLTKFVARKICIVPADVRNPKTWKHLAEFELKKKAIIRV